MRNANTKYRHFSRYERASLNTKVKLEALKVKKTRKRKFKREECDKKVGEMEKLRMSKRRLRMESIRNFDGSGAAHPTPEELQVAWVMQQRANDVLEYLSSSEGSELDDKVGISSDNNDEQVGEI